MKIELDRRFIKKAAGLFGKYEFEVGVLEDVPYKTPKRGKRGLKGQDVISTYAGGPVRQKTRFSSGVMISEIVKQNQERLGVNFLLAPFDKKGSDIIKFSNEFFKYVFGKSQAKRCENLLQAIVRNPILRGDYGGNSKLTQTIKGFNRGMIDTAQMFKALKARVVVKGVSRG